MNTLLADLFVDARLKKFPKGQVIIYEGDQVNSLHFIKTGYIKVYSIINSGTERIIFIYGPGDVFPMTTFLSGSSMARYFYQAMTDAEVAIMADDKFTNKIKYNLEIGENVFAYTTAINLEFLQRVDILSVNDARRKVVAMLAFLVQKVGTTDQLSKLDLPLIQQDFADLCGLTRETASMQLAKLAKKGIITNGKHLVVNTHKLNKLKAELAINL